MTRTLKIVQNTFLQLLLAIAFAAGYSATAEARPSDLHKRTVSQAEPASELLVKNISIQVHGVVDYGCIGRHNFSNSNLKNHRMFTNALKKKRTFSKNIICLMNNKGKKITLG